MGMHEIGIELNEALGQFERGAHNMCPDEVALFLRASSEALVNYIRNSNVQLGEGAMGYVPTIEIEKIQSVFQELADNFFPMAHTNRPLGELRIFEIDKIRMIEMFLVRSNDLEASRRDLNERFFALLREFDLH